MLIKKPKLFVIYDIDDTLVQTMDVFRTVISYFVNYDRLKNEDYTKLFNDPRLWYKELKTTKKENIIKDVFDSDMNLIIKLRKENKNPYRYEVFREALCIVASKHNIALSYKYIDSLAKIAFDYRLLPKKETIKGIKLLKKESLEHKIEFLIFSKGTYDVQTKKLEYLGMDFIKNENIYIGMEKSSQHLKDFLERYGNNHFIIIGDSLKDDMHSAAEINELNIKALWIKHNDFFSWNFDKELNIKEYSNEELKNIIKNLFY